MSQNRILLRYGPICRHCRTQDRIDRLTPIAEDLAHVAGPEVLQYSIPSASHVVDDGYDLEVYFLCNMDIEPVGADADIPGHLVRELRRISLELANAADRVEMLGKGVL